MEEVISVENLVQIVRKNVVLDDVSFKVNSGETFGLCGTHGSGKTSLLHILAGIERFTSGSVTVLGCDIKKTEQFKKGLGLVTQEPSLFKDLSGEENLDFICALKGAETASITETIERLDLKDCLKKRAARLDPGEYKRLSLGCAMLGDPQVLLVDELDSNLDMHSLNLILGQLRAFHDRGGTSIVAVSQPELCDLADRAGWLENGSLTLWESDRLKREWAGRFNSALERRGGCGN